MDDQMIITVKRTVLTYYRIWSEDVLEETRLKCVKLYDSVSQEELRRFVDMGLIDADGYMTKTFPLAKIFIRPVTFNS